MFIDMIGISFTNFLLWQTRNYSKIIITTDNNVAITQNR